MPLASVFLQLNSVPVTALVGSSSKVDRLAGDVVTFVKR